MQHDGLSLATYTIIWQNINMTKILIWQNTNENIKVMVFYTISDIWVFVIVIIRKNLKENAQKSFIK